MMDNQSSSVGGTRILTSESDVTLDGHAADGVLGHALVLAGVVGGAVETGQLHEPVLLVVHRTERGVLLKVNLLTVLQPETKTIKSLIFHLLHLCLK